DARGVEDLALGGDEYAFAAPGDLLHLAYAVAQVVREAEYAAIGLHRAAQVVQHVDHPFAGVGGIEPREARPGVVAAVLRQVARGLRLRGDVLHHLLARGLAEHDQVEQRVRAQAVGAMDRDAGRLAHRV